MYNQSLLVTFTAISYTNEIILPIELQVIQLVNA